MQLTRARLSDDLVVLLAREIVRRELRPGDTLPSEAELAARFGVSKPIVRESIQALASVGMVRVQQGKRTLVQDESEWDVLDRTVQEGFQLEGRGSELTEHLYEVRLILETKAAAFAAQRAPQERIDEMMQLVHQMREIARSSRNLREFLEVDRAFHDAMAKAAGNVALRQVTRSIHAFLSNNWSNSRATLDQLELLAEQHARIADAILARDSGEARRATEAHLSWAQQVEAQRSDRDGFHEPHRTRGRDG